jgi:hypothetical protein
MPIDPTKMLKKNTATDASLEEAIRHRAYELYEERGCEDGHNVDDWLRAEAEITGAVAKAA